MRVYRAGTVRYRVLIGGAIILVAIEFWALRHVYATLAVIDGYGAAFGPVYTVAFVLLALQMFLCYLERPYTVTRAQRQALHRKKIAASVPVYNEDPAALRRGLESLLIQTWQLDTIYVVDDGSKAPAEGGPDYSAVKTWFLAEAAAIGTTGVWVRQSNGGKRSAQGRMVRDTQDADFYLTLDSDSLLAPDAVEEAVKPFADPRVFSVAGVVLNINNTGAKCTPTTSRWRRLEHALVSRATSLWFLIGQMVDRSSASTLGAVLVNSGPLAMYRSEILRDNLDGYLNEYFFDRPVELSDDSMLTIYALLRGKAVQQPTAFSFSLMPERTSHHLRQYLRWMRGAFIRSWWRLRYLPLSSWAFWSHVIGWAQMSVSTMVFGYLFVVQPIQDTRLIATLPWLLVIPLCVGYGHALRAMIVRRDDDSLASQMGTLALAPLATLWSFLVLRFVRWYAMATCLKTGWGTRADVEISMVHHGQEETAVLDYATIRSTLGAGTGTGNRRPSAGRTLPGAREPGRARVEDGQTVRIATPYAPSSAGKRRRGSGGARDGR
jgi:hyaluronan synthase